MTSSSTHFSRALDLLEEDKRGKGLAFELAVKWWLKNDPLWSGQFVPESVKLWGESSLRDGPDIGIDLTAESRSGGMWAIQVKNWRESTSLPKKEVDSFLSASGSGKYVGRLLVTTTNQISRNALRAIKSQSVPCVVVDRGNLEASQVWQTFSVGSYVKPVTPPLPKRLLPHQTEAVEAVCKYFQEGGKRAQVAMACGSGKTLTAQRISEKLGANLTLVLVPSLLLLQQTLASWRQNRSTDFIFQAVCSDETVAKDEFATSTLDLPFPVTTEPGTIAKFIASPENRVVFSTYQSSGKLAEAMAIAGTRFDIVIADEAHRLAGLSDGDFGSVLRSESMDSDRFLFMTATPRVFGSRVKKAADKSGVTLYSMDDESKFGPEVFSYSFARAIHEDRLTDYKVVIMGVTDSEIADRISARQLADSLGMTLDLKTLAAHVGLAKAMEKYGVHRAISFHSRVSKAKEFAEVQLKLQRASFFGKQLNLEVSTYLSGEHSALIRERALTQLASIESNQYGLIANARCLTEGVDVPNLDGIAFIEPRTSQVDIVQAVGRAIRKAGDLKKTGFIIIPVFTSPEEIAAEKLESGKFKAIWEVVNALKAHDETLRDQLDKIRQELGRGERITEFPEKVIVDVPVSLPANFIRSIEAQIIDLVTESWDEWFGRLEKFTEKFGHQRINRERDSEHKALGSWLTKQRADFKAGALSRRKISLLENLKGWEWDPFTERWDGGYSILSAYVQEHGHARPPAQISYLGFPLGRWVSKNRLSKDTIESDRKEKLERLPGWSWDPFTDQWNQSVEELTELRNSRGELAVKREDRFQDGRSMRGWIVKQRVDRDNLSQAQIKTLEAIPGWQWKRSREEERKEALFEYAREFGTVRTISSLNGTFNGEELWTYIQNIRGHYREGKLSTEETREFELLPGWTWNSKFQEWTELFEALSDFVEQYGRLPVKDERHKDMGIGRFALRQRRYFAKGELSEEKIKLLEQLPGWSWDPAMDFWLEVLQEVKDYLTANGDLPKGTVPGQRVKRLDSWLYNQRKTYESLTANQQSQLRNLPGFTPLSETPSEEEKWKENLRRLKDFFTSEGRPPKYHSELDLSKEERLLGLWMYRQTSRWERLSETQRQSLREIPGFHLPVTRENKWTESLRDLSDYVKAHDSIPPLRQAGVEFPVGAWLRRQKKNWDGLSEIQRAALMEIPRVGTFIFPD